MSNRMNKPEDMQYIEHFHYFKMWNIYDVLWDNINPDVNILVGINGAGKTTLLDNIYDYYSRLVGSNNKSVVQAAFDATGTTLPVQYIRSFDVPSSAKKNTTSPLYAALYNVVYQNSERKSFFDYRMRALNYKDQTSRIEARIEKLFQIINNFFEETQKQIEFDLEDNKLVFRTKDGTVITLDKLSSGEKQLLLILLNVFLMDEKPHILLLDEPELSLHIEWQRNLIQALRKLNPNCQLIITTHSPSIFAAGWQNKIVYMDDITHSI